MKKPYIKVFSYGKFVPAAQSLRAEKETRYYMGKKGNVAIITGASSGMGREFAIQIAQFYPSIQEFWIIARRKERLEELQEKLLGSRVQRLHILELLLKERQVRLLQLILFTRKRSFVLPAGS